MDGSINEILSQLLGDDATKEASDKNSSPAAEPVSEPAKEASAEEAGYAKLANSLPPEVMASITAIVEKDEAEKQAAAEMKESEKQAAEAEATGRIMAHAFVGELNKIASGDAEFSSSDITDGAATVPVVENTQQTDGSTVLNQALTVQGIHQPAGKSPTAGQDTINILKKIKDAANANQPGPSSVQRATEVPNNLGAAEGTTY